MTVPRSAPAAPSPYAVGPGEPERNRRVAGALIGACALGPALVVWIVVGIVWSWAWAVIPGVVVAAALAALLWRAAPGAVLAGLSPARVAPAAEARLHSLVESMCVAAGVPRPRVLVVEGEAPNALSVGRDPRAATLVVTAGLVDKLTRVELEGVVAHEITHIRRGDIAVTAVAAVTIAPLARVAPAAALGVWRWATGRREALADMGAVGLTRYPPGLCGALEKMRDDPGRPPPLPAVVDLAWAMPVRRGGDEGSLADPMEGRLQALREL